MNGEKRLFLDVRKSATGLAWEHRLDARQENIALAVSQTHGIPDIVARVLAGRGIGIDEAPAFLASQGVAWLGVDDRGKVHGTLTA